MATPNYELGTLYPPPKGINQIWSQPGGPFTTVFPQQATANSDQLSTTPYSELTGSFIFGCGHSANMVYAQREVDADDNIPVALLLCPLCGYTQRLIKPWSEAFIGSVSYLQNALLLP